ncbi:MAG: general secretion pathway protein GspK [Candidatus Omnitrophica bacterium]|nr:general secretion pathway protein GspK [Candidatus Omnitrophota bacterium]
MKMISLNSNIKKSLLLSGRFNRSGIILVASLWVVIILVIIAVGLSHKTSVDLAFGKFVFAKSQAAYAARAGISYALREIRDNKSDGNPADVDTHYACGVNLKDGQSIEQKWKDIPLENGSHFTIVYKEQTDHGIKKYLGLADEERKININAIMPQDVGILKFLLTLQGVGEEDAHIAAASIIDWKDPDEEITDGSYGAETEFYKSQGSGYVAKNAPFDSVGELRLVRGVTPEIFDKLKDLVTVFPKEGRFQINANTASPVVIKAVVSSVVGPATNTDEAEVLSLMDKIIELRNGEDGVLHTADDRPIDEKDLPLNAKEKTLFYYLMQYHAPKSRFFRITSEGVAGTRQVKSRITAVVNQEDFSTVYWFQD